MAELVYIQHKKILKYIASVAPEPNLCIVRMIKKGNQYRMNIPPISARTTAARTSRRLRKLRRPLNSSAGLVTEIRPI